MAALLLFALIFSACGEAPVRKAYRSGTEYMPLLDGRTLRYRERGDGETYEYTLTLKYIGGRAWKVYTTHDENIPYGRIEFTSNGTIVEASTLISLTSLESRKQVSAFNQVWVDAGAEVDSVWRDEATGTETVVAGYETVTVPAGTFTECLKTVTTPLPEVADSVEARYQRGDSDEKLYIEEREVVNWQTVRWFAAGVGLVKEQVGPAGDMRITRELVALEAEGVGLVDSAYIEIENPNIQTEPKLKLDTQEEPLDLQEESTPQGEE